MNRTIRSVPARCGATSRCGESGGASSRRRESGGALIVALCATIPLLIAGGTLLVTVMQGRRATEAAGRPR
jgi:hypothetical protein